MGIGTEINIKMESQLVKRSKSLLWRAGIVGAAAAIAELSVGLNEVGLPEIAVVALGLVLGEVTKYLNRSK